MSAEQEQQFILRLPPDHADRVREAIRSDSLGDRLQVEFFRDKKHARVKFDNEELSGRLVTLPCMIESHKTLDRRTLYKTGDVGQMLACSTDPMELPSESVEEMTQSKRKEYFKKFTWNHGIAPPLKNVRKRRFRKIHTKKFVDSPEVEKEVRRLIREDLNAVKVSFKVLTDEDKHNEDSPSVLSEGDALASRGHTPSVLQDEDSLMSTPPSHNIDDRSELLRMLEEASCSSSESSDEEEEEIAVDDNEPGVVSLEVEALRSAVLDLETQIEEQRLKILNTTNSLLKQRFESFLHELEKQRRAKLNEIDALES